MRRGVQLALRTGRKRQQLLIVLRGQRQFPHGLCAERLAGRGVRRFHACNLRGYFHLLTHRTGLERDRDFRSLRHAYFNARGFGLREARFIYHHDVGSWREQGRDERSVRVCRNLARQRLRARVNDLHLRAGNRPATRIHHCAADGSRRAALSVGARTRQNSNQQQYNGQKPMNASHKFLSPSLGLDCLTVVSKLHLARKRPFS